jgi:hypothetical protein
VWVLAASLALAPQALALRSLARADAARAAARQARAKLPPAAPGAPLAPVRTWVHELFQGTLTNQTRCSWCEAVTNREESYLDLSLDIAHHASVGACLAGFSAVETLSGADKFHCDACAGLQEARKRLLLRAAPPVLALHLKRFKFVEAVGAYTKLSHRVAFPTHLRLDGTCVEAGAIPEREAAYALFAVVVHVGSGPNHGHYVTVVKQQAAAAAAAAATTKASVPCSGGAAAAAAASDKSGGAGSQWVHFDDESVEAVGESVLTRLFGSELPPPPPGDAPDAPEPPPDAAAGAEAASADAAQAAPAAPAAVGPSSTEHGYILFYERIREETPPATSRAWPTAAAR